IGGGKKYFLRWAVFWAVFLLILLPWSFRNYKHFGKWQLTSTGTGYGFYVTGRMTEGLSWDEANNEYILLRYGIPARHIPASGIAVRSGGSPTADFDFESEAQKTGISLIRKNFSKYFFIVVKRLPRFWITSHSSVFGVDRPLSGYLGEKKYAPVIFRLGLLALNGMFVVVAVVGAVLSRRNRLGFIYIAAIVVYFTGHIAFDPCPRYHLPAMPYIFIFCAVGFLVLKRKLCNQQILPE
ncbi:MAG: hypothetical protein QME32_00790, partial [Endomicrobiia bacterium]|nr:hypothetical protein [Endomicrobiia bacterium]